MVSIVFAFLAFLGWGSGDIFGGIVARRAGGYTAALWLYLCGFVICSAYAPFAPSGSRALAPEMLLLLTLLAGLGLVTIVALYEGLRLGNATLVGAIAGSFAGPTVGLSVAFFGDTLTGPQLVALVTIVVGVVLASVDLRCLRAGRLLSDRGLPYAFVALITLALYFTLLRVPVRRAGWFWPTYLPSLVTIPVLYLLMRMRGLQAALPGTLGTLVSAAMNGVCLYGGGFAYNVAVAHGETALAAPIAGAYPALFVLLAARVFHDPLRGQQIAGIAITLTGIVLLSILSA